MWLRCDHKELTVHVRDDVQDTERRPVYGLFEPAEGRIYLARCTPRRDRRRVLVHELAHAFEHFMGRVADDDTEGRQNRTAMVEGSFNAALEAQDGEYTFHQMFGEPRNYKPVIIAHGEADLAPLPIEAEGVEPPIRICCPHCHQSQPPRNVQYGMPSLHLRLNLPVMWGVLNCLECERELTFLQLCTSDGVPLPKIVDGTVTSRRVIAVVEDAAA